MIVMADVLLSHAPGPPQTIYLRPTAIRFNYCTEGGRRNDHGGKLSGWIENALGSGMCWRPQEGQGKHTWNG